MVSQQWDGQVEFVGVAWTGSESDFQNFIDDYSLTFPNISDGAGDVYDRFGIPYQPAFVLVSADGAVEQIVGAADEDLLNAIIGDLV